MKYSATKLRQNLYQILDQVLEKGIPVEIERKGKILRIVPETRKKKTDNLMEHKIINGKAESIIYNDWEKNWKGKKLI